MGRFRCHAFGIVILALAFGVLVAHSQSTDERHVILNVGLPAIDVGLLQDETHAPQTPETRKRVALAAALDAGREGRLGSRYVPGRVIVKFRDETPAARLA